MTTLLRSGVEWLRDRLDEAAGESVTIIDGPRSWTINAVPMTRSQEIITAEGIGTVVEEMLFAVKRATLVSEGIAPKAGMQVVFDSDTYDMIPLDNRDIVTPHEQFREMVDIHTQLSKRPRAS